MVVSYIQPTSTTGFPGGLTLTQYIQAILVGLSDLDGDLVRPKWQTNPPKNPSIDTNWIAFQVVRQLPDTYAFIGSSGDDSSQYQRQEGIEVQVSFYGPNALDLAQLVSDGFQIPQNREALTLANMAFTETGQMNRVPDLMNERWVDRIEMQINLRRQIQREYAIPALVSANGTVHTVLKDGEYTFDWQTPEES